MEKNLIYISKLKKQAKLMTKSMALPHSEALDYLARKEGYIGWHNLMKNFGCANLLSLKHSGKCKKCKSFKGKIFNCDYCQNCHKYDWSINGECPHCSAEIKLTNHANSYCPKCGNSLNYRDIKEMIAPSPVYTNVKEALTDAAPEIGCEECLMEDSIVEVDGIYLCTNCFEFFHKIHQCEYCGHYSNVFHKYSGLEGCGFCDGNKEFYED